MSPKADDTSTPTPTPDDVAPAAAAEAAPAADVAPDAAPDDVAAEEAVIVYGIPGAPAAGPVVQFDDDGHSLPNVVG